MIEFKTKSIFDAVEMCWESNVLPDIFFHDQKMDVTSSVNFSSFLKYIFRHKLAVFCYFSQQFFTLYCLWVIVIPFL